MPRRFPIFQFPNRPLVTSATACLVAWAGERGQLGPGLRHASPFARLVGELALLVWAFEEIASGANWFRRVLGLGGGGYALGRLLDRA